MSSSPSQTGEESKAVTFDISLFPSPSRGIKRSIEDANLYLDDPVVEKRRRRERMTPNRLTSDNITYSVGTFTPASLWAPRTCTVSDSHSIYDVFEEEVEKLGTLVEVMEHSSSSPSTSTTSFGLYIDVSRAICRLIEGNITRSELIEGLQRVASQLKQWG
ncbi:uncharacterized protein BT62DRAFT_1076723 [Guyanagaster necrorhizus]|uniref:Uncharacterized protein n=1 Tax=Guyanagaster necrorhizus TaxID=856835 RepID=A0A9P8AS08_9AGAR|nr:uncharacterized protein BT62DRAFT_1076723 [Guyanagaster necrorhizus MCA 3950]KAG7445640.1 hypothetical protein BT62DRAFT_1076723 [Guyanagaster necrorhizus MCA 3950]